MTEQYIRGLIERSRKEFELQSYRDRDIHESHVPYEGTPRKHPYDANILILVPDPFADREKTFYEFTVDSIGLIEELQTISNERGDSAIRVRVWVKKGKTAIKSTPFVVG